jgi:23S rRNA U2552 (ribose-2'-O)-methylase RlmE/FtsJ
MNDLERFFYANTENLIHKWKHYFEIYDRHFSRFRGTEVTVLEMGVGQGGSLRMWRSYFGPRARIVGVDINPECATLASDQIEILLANQDDRESLRALKTKIPHVNILIDDGGHTMQQQITRSKNRSRTWMRMASTFAKTCTRRIGPTGVAGSAKTAPSSNSARN